jgi:hypothetical protein
MLLILERDQFIKLFKFGEIKISVNRFIDGYEIENGKPNIPISLLDSKMPLFEQDHEILILEIPKETLIIGIDISVRVSHIKKIYPLTEEANKYLIGRMHPSIVIQKPIFEKLIIELKINRDLNLRLKAWDALSKIFKIDKRITDSYSNEIEDGIKTRLGVASNKHLNKYIYNLICYNRKPIYPQGNIEYLFKAGSVFVEMKGGTELQFEQGPYYKFLNNNVPKFSKRSLEDSITLLKGCNESKTLIEDLNKQYLEIDALTTGIWFLYFADVLNKNNFDLRKIEKDISILKTRNPKEVAVILQMIGMLFNFDNLYSSLYELNPISIFNKDVEPSINEQNKILKVRIKEVESKFDELKFELDRCNKIIEDLEFLVNKKDNTVNYSQKQIDLIIDLLREQYPDLYKNLKSQKSGVLNYSFIMNFLKELNICNNKPDKNLAIKETKGQNIEIETDLTLNDKINIEDNSFKNVEIELPTITSPACEMNNSIKHFEELIQNEDFKINIDKNPDEDEAQVHYELDSQKEKNESIENEKGELLIMQVINEKDLNPDYKLKNKAVEKEIKKQKKATEILQKKGTKETKSEIISNSITLNQHLNYTENQSNKSEFYDIFDLKNIILDTKEIKAFSDPNEEQTFEEAIMNYSTNHRVQVHLLINEIEILQTDLGLSEELVSQLKTIIINVKK